MSKCVRREIVCAGTRRECHVTWTWSYRQLWAIWCRCWVLNSHPPEEQDALLASEQFFQVQIFPFNFYIFSCSDKIWYIPDWPGTHYIGKDHLKPPIFPQVWYLYIGHTQEQLANRNWTGKRESNGVQELEWGRQRQREMERETVAERNIYMDREVGDIQTKDEHDQNIL